LLLANKGRQRGDVVIYRKAGISVSFHLTAASIFLILILYFNVTIYNKLVISLLYEKKTG
jgi:hypothetical protein